MMVRPHLVVRASSCADTGVSENGRIVLLLLKGSRPQQESTPNRWQQAAEKTRRSLLVEEFPFPNSKS